MSKPEKPNESRPYECPKCGSPDCGSYFLIPGPGYKETMPCLRRQLAALQAELDAERRAKGDLVAACREAIVAVDEAYTATGYFKVAVTSKQRLRIEAALAQPQETSDDAK